MKRRRTALAALLSRLGRAQPCWRIPCRDRHGRRAEIRIDLHDNGIALHPTAPEPLILGPLAIGRLRNALRDAAIAYGEVRATDEEVPDDHDRHAA